MSAFDTLKAQGVHKVKATVRDIYDSTRTSTAISITVRNRVPSIAVTYPAANALFKMYDTLRIKVKCFDSNKTLDTIIIFDSIPGTGWTAIDTMTPSDSTAGGYYTMSAFDTLKAQGVHKIKATVRDIYDSTRTSAAISINVRNRVPSISVINPTAGRLYKMYDTLRVKVKCYDSNKTLDTIIIFDSIPGTGWTAIDTMTPSDSTAGGYYTMSAFDTLKAQGVHKIKATVRDIYDSTRTSTAISITVRNRVPSIAVTSPATGTEYTTYDTIRVTAKCVDSDKTLDTLIFYDSLAGSTWKAFDTLTPADSTAGGIYVANNYDTLFPGGTHYLKVVVKDIYDSTRASALVSVLLRPPTAVTLSTPTYLTTDGMTLTWTANSDTYFSAYKIYYSTTSPVDSSKTMFGPITNKNVTSMALTGLSTATLYYVKIYVYNQAGQCKGSNEVSATTN
jgi:type IV pilus biogenesis protein CpaD/CtpE